MGLPAAVVQDELVHDPLSPEDLSELMKRAAGADEAERCGKTIAFEDLIDEVEQILHGAVSDPG